MQRLTSVRKKITAQVAGQVARQGARLPDDAAEGHSERPQSKKQQPPKISPAIAPFYVGAAFIGGLIVALVGELMFGNSMLRWVFWAFAFGLGIGGVFLARFILNNLIERAAPYLLSPRSVPNMQEAQELLRDYLENDSLPRLVVREGQISQDTVATLQTLRYQPGRLEVDRVSAVLLWQQGGYILRGNGRFPYTIYQQIIGVLDLRPQFLPFDEAFWTIDAMRVQIKGIISYALIQDDDYFKEHSNRVTTMEVAQRALLPNADWQEKTKRFATSKLRDVVKQTAFSDFFVTPNHLNQLDLFETIRRFYTQQPLKSITDEIRTRLKTETRERLGEWGVEIRNVTFDTIGPPADFAEAAKRLHEGWLRQLDKEGEEAHTARAEIERANRQFNLAQLAQKTKVTEAETEKQVKQLNAEAEAAEHETRMKARGMGAVEFARRIETLRQAMGNTLDEGTFRELLRALDLLREDEREEIIRDGYSRLMIPPRGGRMDE